MHLSIHNRTLLRGMLASAVVLAGTSACSRSDRADAGRDTTQTGTAVAPSDTQTNAAIQRGTADTVAASSSDTATTTPQTATPRPRPKPSSPAPVAPDSSVESGDQGVSGYQAMGHDTAVSETASPSDTTAPEMAGAAVDTTTVAADQPNHAMADTAAAPGVSTDTTVSGYEPMARDTSTVLAQGEPAAQAQIDTTTQAEADTATIHAQVDTTAEVPTEVAVEDQADSLAKYHEADRVRPPEDSTEVLGQVTTDEANYDVEAVGDANADAVGAAQVESTGNIATGADAVALMTREGQPCRVEDSRDVQWDLAGSPATLNPCGTGTMTLPKVQTGEK
jgi:hypothetical protein